MTTGGDDQADGGIQERLRLALSEALRSRDREAVAALRSALSTLANAEAVPAPASAAPPGSGPHIAGAATGLGAAEAERRHVGEAEAARIIRVEISERLAAAAQYETAGHADRAARLRREAAALSAAAGMPS